MAEDETSENEATDTDIFQQQKQTIDLLYDVLQRQQGEITQPTYVTPIQQTKPAPNYISYIAIGALAIWFLKG